MTIDPTVLEAGTAIRHRSGAERVLDRRKPDGTGWWLTDGSGLDDRLWRDGGWSVADPAAHVLARIESRLGRIDAAIHQLTQEVLHLSDTQTQINTDVSALTQALADFAAEWQQISQRLAMEAPQIDTSKLDALATQAQQMDAAWKGQLAPAPTAPAPTGSDTATGTASTAPDPTGTGTASSAAADSNPPATTETPAPDPATTATPDPATTATTDPATTATTDPATTATTPTGTTPA